MHVPIWFPQMDGPTESPKEAIGLNLEFPSIDTNALQPVQGITSNILMVQDEEQQLLELYYQNFHAAHPILPPMRSLSQLPAFSPSLDAVVKFIGSHFDDNIESERRSRAVRAAFKAVEPNSYQKVQALLLFAVDLHACNHRDEAMVKLDMAIAAALDLGLNSKDFPARNGIDDPVVQESIRRTWWELYVVDGMVAALHQKMDFRTKSIPTNVGLPCDEHVYLQAGFIPQPHTIVQLQNRSFAEDELEFSSCCYRIDAIQLLGRVMAVGGDNIEKDQVEGIDAALAGWAYLLPPTKQEILEEDGTVDEMLFQAFMIVSCAMIYLHLPRSDLIAHAQGPSATMPCAERLSISLPASTPHTHAVKTIQAANKLSSLASLQVPAEKHTPFFICSLVLDSIVQLSACSIKACHCLGLDVHRDGITLAIGVLKALAKTWPISDPALQQVKAVARRVLEIGVHPESPQRISSGESVDIHSIISSEVLLGDTPDLDESEIQLPI